ncbi:MAG: hypothetical protein L6Q92_06720 [Phycisphaerae bacterium]|nr:hypothetical protein [Phycisphaerae bacterium]
MALEAYIPTDVRFDDQPVENVFVITLHESDSPAQSGSMTTPDPIDHGRSGRLVFTGLRDGKEWRITLPEVSIRNRTALGCEYTWQGPVQREMLRVIDDRDTPHQKAFEERFDIR